MQAPSAGKLVIMLHRHSTKLTAFPVTTADQQQAECFTACWHHTYIVTHTLCPSCRCHVELCWRWRSEEPDRAALDSNLGMEGLTSSAALAGDESAGRC